MKKRTIGEKPDVNIRSLEMSIPKNNNDLSPDGSLGNHALIEKISQEYGSHMRGARINLKSDDTASNARSMSLNPRGNKVVEQARQ